MAMSKILAEYRAKQIWGAQVEEVLLVEGFWSVLLLSEVAYLHKFDGNGRVICHWDCANLRFNYVCEYMKTKKAACGTKRSFGPTGNSGAETHERTNTGKTSRTQ